MMRRSRSASPRDRSGAWLQHRRPGAGLRVLVNDGGVINIAVTTTTRGCPATNYLKEGARDAARAVPGVEFVDVTLTYEPPWSPQKMGTAGKEYLGIAQSDE